MENYFLPQYFLQLLNIKTEINWNLTLLGSRKKVSWIEILKAPDEYRPQRNMRLSSKLVPCFLLPCARIINLMPGFGESVLEWKHIYQWGYTCDTWINREQRERSSHSCQWTKCPSKHVLSTGLLSCWLKTLVFVATVVRSQSEMEKGSAFSHLVTFTFLFPFTTSKDRQGNFFGLVLKDHFVPAKQALSHFKVKKTLFLKSHLSNLHKGLWSQGLLPTAQL